MLRSDQAAETTLMDWLLNEGERADVARQPYMEEQRELISFYMNLRTQPMPQGLEWVGNELLADAFMLIESSVPATAAGVIGGKSVTVNAYSMAGTQVNKAMDKLLYKLRRAASFEYKTIPSIRMASITGHAWQHNFWVTQWGSKRYPIVSNAGQNAYGEQTRKIVDWEYRQEKVYDGPCTAYPDNERVWASTSRDQMGRPLVMWREMELNIDAMKDLDYNYRQETGEPFYRNLDKFTEHHSANANTAWGQHSFSPPSRVQSATEQVSGINMLTRGNLVSVMQAWAQVPKHIRDYQGEPQARLILYTLDGFILRDVPMPTWNMQSGIHAIKFMQIANEDYGRSPLRWALSEIEQRSQMRNLRLAEAFLNIFRPMVANRNANFDQHDFINAPGAVWFFDHDSYSPQDVIREIQRTPMFQEIYREDALMDEHINRVYGSTPGMQGDGLGSRATAHEAQLVDMRAGGRQDLISSQLSWQYEVEQGKDYLGMFGAFSERPVEVQIDGEEADFPIEIMGSDIDFDYDVEINAGAYGILNQMAVQGLREAVGLAFSDPNAIMELDPRLAMSHLQHRTGMDNVLRPKGEVAQMRQQQQMAALAAQAQSAGGPGGVPA